MLTTATIRDTAMAFFDACDTGQGWEACSAYCHPDATFAVQAEPLADVTTVKEYADWMKALIGFVPDGSYEMKALALDEERNTVCAYAVFRARTPAKAVRCRLRARGRGRITSTSCTSRTGRSST